MPPAQTILEVATTGPAGTLTLARELGALLRGGDVIALVGELGSGKTTFTRGLCHGLGLADGSIVSSPTYVLEHVYAARHPVHHYDAYRLSTAEEFLALGFAERLDGSRVVVIEWADKVLSLLPDGRLRVDLSREQGSSRSQGSEETDRRRVLLSGPAANWEARLGGLERRLRGLKFLPRGEDR